MNHSQRPVSKKTKNARKVKPEAKNKDRTEEAFKSFVVPLQHNAPWYKRKTLFSQSCSEIPGGQFTANPA